MMFFFKIVEESKLLGIQIIDLCGYGDVFLDKELFTKIKYAKKIIQILKFTLVQQEM